MVGHSTAVNPVLTTPSDDDNLEIYGLPSGYAINFVLDFLWRTFRLRVIVADQIRDPVFFDSKSGIPTRFRDGKKSISGIWNEHLK
jgi:hypothetical protein